MHIVSHVDIAQIPADCIRDCSCSGRADDAVAHWLKELEFTVDRARAIRCLQGYGAWDGDELDASTDEELASRVLWLACNDFSEFMTHCEGAGVDWRSPLDDFDPSSGSDIFVLE